MGLGDDWLVDHLSLEFLNGCTVDQLLFLKAQLCQDRVDCTLFACVFVELQCFFLMACLISLGCDL